jgi:gliding motility-associated-like protein
LQSPSTFTSGFISFNYTVATSGPVTGFTSPSNGLPNNHTVADKLINHSDIYQDVIYSVVPVSPVTGCAVGATKSFSVRVNPTPRAKPFNPPVISTDSSICFAGTTNILLTTPTEMTSGNILFDFKVTVSGSSGVVSGDTTHATGKTPGYFINRSYQNSSDTIQSVFFSITPRVDNAVCNKGPAVVSQIRVHARTLQSLVITKPLTCAGGAGLAALRAVISKGANPYQVIWDGPFGYHKVDSLDITNLGTGKYTVRVTDNRNCFRRDSISLSPVAAKAYISAAVIPPGNYNISCIGSADGTISIAVTGGITPPYIYWLVKNDIDTLSTGVFSDNLNITDPTTYRIINNLGAASYTLIIKDINGCVDLKKIIFRTPPPMVNWFSKSTFGAFNVSCKGYSDGYAKADSTRGGRGSYTYRWYTFNGNIPGPINTNRIDNIPAGKYYLETKDVLNCVKIDSITLTEPNGMLLAGSQLSKSTDNNFNISCNGGNDGFIKLNITGGSGIYIVTWTGPNGPYSTKDISGLVAGTYVATVADFYGCVLTPQPSFTLTQPTPLGFNASKSVAVDGINNINCAGGKGSITLSVSGGSIGNYTYLWSTTNGSGIIQGQRDQFALTAGDYTVVVTDLNGCSSSKNITLTQPLPVTTQLIPKHITCYPVGFSNGSINLTVAGGMGSYSFSWSNGATTEDIANLTQGLYKVIVLDGNGCQKKDSATIKLPPSLTISSNVPAFNGFNVSCYGLVDGSIKVTPTSGVAPFIYSWTGPGFTSSNQNISGLIKGQYTLMVTDSNQCKTSQIFNLNEPGKFSMDITPSLSRFGNYNLNCAGDSTAKITIDPVNGVGAVAYHWSDGNIAKVRTGLPAGKYNIIILDQNNCHADSSITLRQPDSIKTSFVVRQAFCPDSPDGEIQLHVSGGVIVSDYMYRWSDNSTTQTLSDVLRGYYKVLVTDANNCSKKDSVLMEPLHETCLVIPNAISPNNDNINDVWNIGMIYLYPKVEIKVFNRWGETIWRSEPGYPHPWDGRSNGALLPIDSYYYIIDLHNGSRPISGSITIVR